MIPAYKEEVQLKSVLSSGDPVPLRECLSTLENQITQLRETVDYLKRESNRLKSDVQTLAQTINRQ